MVGDWTKKHGVGTYSIHMQLLMTDNRFATCSVNNNHYGRLPWKFQLDSSKTKLRPPPHFKKKRHAPYRCLASLYSIPFLSDSLTNFTLRMSRHQCQKILEQVFSFLAITSHFIHPLHPTLQSIPSPSTW